MFYGRLILKWALSAKSIFVLKLNVGNTSYASSYNNVTTFGSFKLRAVFLYHITNKKLVLAAPKQ